MKRFLTAREVAEITGLKRSAAYELMHSLGSVVLLKRACRLDRAKLDAFLRERHSRAPAGESAEILAASLSSLPGIAPPATPGVYAIQGVGGFVKIGRAKNIAYRLRKIQNAHPTPIKLLAILSPDPEDERAHHHRWAHLRRAGEWFAPDHELIEHLAQLRAESPT